MFHQKPIRLLDFVMSISSAIDHIDSRIADHHMAVAYIANQLARELRLPLTVQYELVLAGLLHDIGMLSIPGPQRLLDLESNTEINRHCEIGYQLLRQFSHFSTVAEIIRHHHCSLCDSHQVPTKVALTSALLNLADEIDRLIDKHSPLLEQVDYILGRISRLSGERFDPALVEVFAELATKEYFWLDLGSPSLERVLLNNCNSYSIELGSDDLLDFAEMFAYIIDFRCHFTATHSSGVATVASILAHMVGFSASECRKMQVAGYLHDIGKLAVPQDILEKPGKLTRAEHRILKSHAYFTYRILEPLQDMDDIKTWAAMHHERLDGNGYPGRCKAQDLPLGARVMAVADVFTALLEARPYRGAIDKHEVIKLLTDMAHRQALDSNLISVVADNFDNINAYRICAQDAAHREYTMFLRILEQPIPNTEARTDTAPPIASLALQQFG